MSAWRKNRVCRYRKRVPDRVEIRDPLVVDKSEKRPVFTLERNVDDMIWSETFFYKQNIKPITSLRKNLKFKNFFIEAKISLAFHVP